MVCGGWAGIDFCYVGVYTQYLLCFCRFAAKEILCFSHVTTKN